MHEQRYEFDERLYELLEQLSPSEDYRSAVNYFSGFRSGVPEKIARHLDGYGRPLEYGRCSFPDIDKNPRQKGFLIVEDYTFGEDDDSGPYWEVLMPFSELLRWLRTIARLWSEFHPHDATALQQIFHSRNLGYRESEVGPQFDNGTTWWGKIEQQRVMARTTCQIHVSSPQWRYAGDYFHEITDAAFPAWLRTLSEGGELPSHWFQARRLPTGGLKILRPSWNNGPEHSVELTRNELEMVLTELGEAFAGRRPRHAEEVRSLLGQIKSRS